MRTDRTRLSYGFGRGLGRGLGLGLGLGLVALAGCEPVYLIEPSQDETATVHEGTITADETWRADDNPHKVIGSLLVAGPNAPTLTLEAGVRVLFQPGGELRIATDSLPGALHAVGSGDDPVELMSEQQYQSRGYWASVHFAPMAGDSRLEHVHIQDCGGTADWPESCLRIFGSRQGRPHPVVRDVRIAFSRGYGVVAAGATGFGEGSGEIRFVSLSDYPVRVEAEGAWTLPPGLRATDGTEPSIQIGGGSVQVDRTWPNTGMPYVVVGPVQVGGEGGATLTLPAGTELQFGRDGELVVGVDDPGTLVAEGTANDPVVFTSPEKAPRSWRGLVFGGQASPDSRLSQTVIEYGGFPSGYNSSANATLMRDIGPFIRESVIRHSSGCGIVRRAFGGAWTTDFTDPALGNRFEGNEDGAQCNAS